MYYNSHCKDPLIDENEFQRGWQVGSVRTCERSCASVLWSRARKLYEIACLMSIYCHSTGKISNTAGHELVLADFKTECFQSNVALSHKDGAVNPLLKKRVPTPVFQSQG